MAQWVGVQGRPRVAIKSKNTLTCSGPPREPQTANEKLFVSISTRRLAESVEGLNSSLALASGDLWPKTCGPIYRPALSLKGFKPKPVVSNIFQAATNFETQFKLSTPFRNFPVRHMKCSCVFTIENHSDSKITYDITMPKKNSYIKFMHMTASVKETYPCRLE